MWRRLQAAGLQGGMKYSKLSRTVTEKLSQLIPLDANVPVEGSRKPLFGLDAKALAATMVEIREPAWRGSQLAEAMYRQQVAEISEITTLPKSLRERLSETGWEVGRPRIAQVFKSVDGTERYLVQGQGDGGQTVETVWMPEGGEGGEAGEGGEIEARGAGDAGPRGRATICVSSQVGCAVNCQFCLTAKLGLQRNLSAGEIAGQVIAVLDRQRVEVGLDRVNLVFMGMGEPFLNYDGFMGAVRLLG